MAKLLVIDNYDSFTYNLVQMFMQYRLTISVYRSDKITLDDAEKEHPDYILISPGPKDPAHTGISIPLIKQWYQKIPVMGVCLGMQCINEIFGGQTLRAPLPMHGKTSPIYHDGTHIFSNIPSPFSGARYHSLMCHCPGHELCVTARTRDDDVIMGVSHPEYPLHGVQFHPESFLTDQGFGIIDNFLALGPLETPERIQMNEHEKHPSNHPGNQRHIYPGYCY